MNRRRLLVIVATLVLVAVTIAVFRAFDAVSHSNSDTIRPFLITVAPLWVAYGFIARWWTRRHGAPADRR